MSNVVYLVLVKNQQQVDRFNFSRLKSGIAPSDTLVVMCDTSIHHPITPPDIPLFPFTYAELPSKLNIQVLDRQRIVPGSTHLAVIDFFIQYPTYDFYWFIEYDVDYTGEWIDFFSYFSRDVTSDLLASHIKEKHEEPLWHWWKYSNSQTIQFSKRLRAFLPIYRMSSRMVRGLLDFLRYTQFRAHHEEAIPTIAYANNMVIRDFGGHGSYVHPSDINAHYIEGPDNEDGFISSGSFRYRPEVIPHNEQILPNKLIHPVKRYKMKDSHQ